MSEESKTGEGGNQAPNQVQKPAGGQVTSGGEQVNTSEGGQVNTSGGEQVKIEDAGKAPGAGVGAEPKGIQGKETPIISLNVNKDEVKKVDLEAKPEVDKNVSQSEAKNEVKANDFFSGIDLKAKEGSSKMMKSIESKTPEKKDEVDKILGDSSILQKSVEKESHNRAKKKLRVVQFLTAVVTLIAIAVNGFFFYQLSPGIDLFGYWQFDFRNNLTNELTSLNRSLRGVQTDLNKYNYLIAQLNLNQFGIVSARFFDNLERLEGIVSGEELQRIGSELETQKAEMPDLIAQVEDHMLNSVVVETYRTRAEEEIGADVEEQNAIRDTKQAIFALKEQKVAEAEDNEGELNSNEIALYNNASKLVGNSNLESNIRDLDTAALQADLNAIVENPAEEVAKLSELQKQVEELLISTKVDLAAINEIRNERVEWSKVIMGLERVTLEVDNKFSQSESETTYSSYNLDSDSGRLIIAGVNTTSNGENRKVVADLIEAFNGAPDFKNAVNRSFPLSRNEDDEGNVTYSMNFRMEMEIGDEEFLENETQLSTEQAERPNRVPVNQ